MPLSIVTLAGFISPCNWRVCGSLPVVYPASFFSPTPATGSIAENTEPIATLLGDISPLLVISYPAVSTPQIAHHLPAFNQRFVALAHKVLPFANCPIFHNCEVRGAVFDSKLAPVFVAPSNPPALVASLAHHFTNPEPPMKLLANCPTLCPTFCVKS